MKKFKTLAAIAIACLSLIAHAQSDTQCRTKVAFGGAEAQTSNSKPASGIPESTARVILAAGSLSVLFMPRKKG